MFTEWEEQELEPGVVLVTLDGKLRGSRARQLGEQLEAASARSIARVVLDLRSVVSIDSLGTQALEEAHERGLQLDLVVRRGFELDDGRDATALARRGLRILTSLEVPAIAR